VQKKEENFAQPVLLTAQSKVIKYLTRLEI